MTQRRSAKDQPARSDQTAAREALEAELRGLSYEAAREQLVEVVRRLETGGATLEESLDLWERGEALSRVCQAWLDGARERLERATGGPDAERDDIDDEDDEDTAGPG